MSRSARDAIREFRAESAARAVFSPEIDLVAGGQQRGPVGLVEAAVTRMTGEVVDIAEAVDAGEQGGARLRCPLQCLLDAPMRRLQIEVIGDGLVDQPVELGAAKPMVPIAARPVRDTAGLRERLGQRRGPAAGTPAECIRSNNLQ